MGRRRSAEREHWPQHLYKNSQGTFWYKNTLNGRAISLGAEERKAIDAAHKLNMKIDSDHMEAVERIPDAIGIRRLDKDGLLSEWHIVGKSIKVDDPVGIYFLLRENKVVYVGQSTNCARRIGEHLKDIKKRFDSYFIVECEPMDLDEMERQYIHKFRPEFNIAIKRPRVNVHSMLGII